MGILKLENVRGSFLNLFQPQLQNDGKKTYGGTFIFPPDHPAKAALEAEMAKVATEKWGAKAATELKALKAGLKVCLRDGDTKPYDGFAGNWFVSTTSKNKPYVLDKDATQLDENSGRVYSGCYLDASIEVWAQDNEFGKRINASLRYVQFRKDGPAFGGTGAPVSMDEFKPIEDEYEDLV